MAYLLIIFHIIVSKSKSPAKKKRKRLILTTNSPCKISKNTSIYDHRLSPLKYESPTKQADNLELKIFKQTSLYNDLKTCPKLYSNLKLKQNGKFDIESEQGQKSCQMFLSHLHTLSANMGIEKASRSYVNKFSKAYKILYQQDDSIYLPEIFDSAQEGYSYLWVNGEKYVFSDDVLHAGTRLKEIFKGLKMSLDGFIDKFDHEVSDNQQFRETKDGLNTYLQKFDSAWANYEKNYILELMVIEADSRRYIQDAINAQTELSKLESSPLDKASKQGELKKARYKLVETICKINAVANVNGKGRDDLTYSIIEHAELCKAKAEDYFAKHESSSNR